MSEKKWMYKCVCVCVWGVGVKKGSKYHNFNTYAHMNFIRTYARTCRKFFLNKKRILYV